MTGPWSRPFQSAPWMIDGACRGMDPDLFHPTRGESAEWAKEICADCPVRTECLDMAIADPSLVGVWGGTSERERHRIRKRIAELTRVRGVA